MIGFIMTILLTVRGLLEPDIQLRLLYLIAAGVFYIGFIQSTK